MNKKAGFLISFVIFMLLFVVGFYMGYKFSGSRSSSFQEENILEIQELQNQINEKNAEISSLQNQLNQASDNEKEECIETLKYNFENENVGKEIIAVFKNNITDEEAESFAQEYNIVLATPPSQSIPSFKIQDNIDVFEFSCYLSKDNRIISANPLVY